MIAQTRAELLKIRTTRTTIGLILGMLALVLLITLLTGLLSHPSGLASKADQRQLFSVGSTAGVFAALAGALLVTSEYRYGTIRPTVLFNPARAHGAANAQRPPFRGCGSALDREGPDLRRPADCAIPTTGGRRPATARPDASYRNAGNSGTSEGLR